MNLEDKQKKIELGKVVARKDARKVEVVVPNERDWMTVLIIVNGAGDHLPNFYIFMGLRKTRCYVSKLL